MPGLNNFSGTAIPNYTGKVTQNSIFYLSSTLTATF